MRVLLAAVGLLTLLVVSCAKPTGGRSSAGPSAKERSTPQASSFLAPPGADPTVVAAIAKTMATEPGDVEVYLDKSIGPSRIVVFTFPIAFSDAAAPGTLTAPAAGIGTLVQGRSGGLKLQWDPERDWISLGNYAWQTESGYQAHSYFESGKRGFVWGFVDSRATRIVEVGSDGREIATFTPRVGAFLLHTDGTYIRFRYSMETTLLGEFAGPAPWWSWSEPPASILTATFSPDDVSAYLHGVLEDPDSAADQAFDGHSGKDMTHSLAGLLGATSDVDKVRGGSGNYQAYLSGESGRAVLFLVLAGGSSPPALVAYEYRKEVPGRVSPWDRASHSG